MAHAVGSGGVEGDDVVGVDLLDLGREPVTLRRAGPHAGAQFHHRAMAIGDGIDQALDLASGARPAALERGAGRDAPATIALALPVALGQIFGDDFGGEHFAAERADDAAFQLASRYRPVVGAAAPFAVGAAAPCFAADDGETAMADAAFDEAGEQSFRAAEPFRAFAMRPQPPAFDLCPDGAIDDREIGHVREAPFGLRIWSRDPLSGLRVLFPALPIVDDAAVIERVVQDPDAALLIAGDRRRAPAPTRRRGHSLLVQLHGDLPRAEPGKIFGEDAADDGRLILDDGAAAAIGAAGGVEAGHERIAVGQAARDPAGGDAADLAAPRLFRDLGELHRGHGAAHADMELADFAFRQCDQADSGEAQAFPDIGDILLIAAYAIDRLGQDDIDAVELVEERVEAGPIAAGAGQSEIGEDVDDVPPLAFRAVAA